MTPVTASQRALRVALVCPYSLSTYGGVQGQVLGLARALGELGVDARVVAPTDGPPPARGVTSVGSTYRFPANGSIAPIASGPAVASRTLEALRTFGPDVLHLHEPFSPGPNHAALMGTRLPVVATFHAAHSGRNGWYGALRLPLRGLAERLDVRTAVSAEACRNVEVDLGWECEIIPNGVDVSAFAEAEPWPAPAPAVCFVGRHEPRKGLGVLLDAFADLDRDAVLWVLGGGPQTEALQARRFPGTGVGLRARSIDERIDHERIEWVGRCSDADKARRLRGSTVACFPSTEGESFGVVLLESMAAGTPVVASDLSGYRAVARDGGEGLLVPPGDTPALVGALRRILDDPAARETFAVAARARAAQHSLSVIAERFLGLYERAIAHRTSSSPRRRFAGIGPR